MAVKERDVVEKGLLKKGCFVKDNNDHKMFRLKVDGKVTGIKTFTSHGSAKYKTLGEDLINLMKRELKLDTNKQFHKLIDCELSGDQYIAILRAKSITL